MAPFHKQTRTPAKSARNNLAAVGVQTDKPHLNEDLDGPPPTHKEPTVKSRMRYALEKLRMFEVVGAENAANQAYLGYATLAFLVNAIDGVPVARPTGKRELEALVARLDDDGLNAVGKHFADTQDFENPDKSADAIGAIKN